MFEDFEDYKHFYSSSSGYLNALNLFQPQQRVGVQSAQVNLFSTHINLV